MYTVIKKINRLVTISDETSIIIMMQLFRYFIKCGCTNSTVVLLEILFISN